MGKNPGKSAEKIETLPITQSNEYRNHVLAAIAIAACFVEVKVSEIFGTSKETWTNEDNREAEPIKPHPYMLSNALPMQMITRN